MMDSSFLDESIFIFHCALTGLAYFAYTESQKVCRSFENLPTYDAGKQLSSTLNVLGKESFPYAAVRGRVRALENSLPTSRGTPAVIQLLLSIDHYRNRIFCGNWGSSESIASSSSVFVPFGLADPSNLWSSSSSSSSSLVVIDEPASADVRSILVTVGSVYETVQSSPLSSFVSSFAGRLRLGTETTEKILPVGTLVTAIGKVTKYSDGSTHISHPHDPNGSLPFILTTLTIDEIKTTYESQTRAYEIGCALLACIGSFFALRIMYKWTSCLYIKRLRKNIVRNRNPNGILGLHDSQICIACLMNPRELLFIPCGHICICVDCLAKLEDNRCPVCRDSILYSYPAFIP